VSQRHTCYERKEGVFSNSLFSRYGLNPAQGAVKKHMAATIISGCDDDQTIVKQPASLRESGRQAISL